MRDEAHYEVITFTITCTMRRRWANQFWSMLQHMQRLGSIGSSRKITLFADGDGDFRPKFECSEPLDLVRPVDDQHGNTFWDAG